MSALVLPTDTSAITFPRSEAPSPTHGPASAGLVPERDAALLLGLKKQTLRKWAVQGKGPARVKLGKRVFYRGETLQAWIAAQERDPAARLSGGAR
jgi:hypothetical protein